MGTFILISPLVFFLTNPMLAEAKPIFPTDLESLDDMDINSEAPETFATLFDRTSGDDSLKTSM